MFHKRQQFTHRHKPREINRLLVAVILYYYIPTYSSRGKWEKTEKNVYYHLDSGQARASSKCRERLIENEKIFLSYSCRVWIGRKSPSRNEKKKEKTNAKS